MILLFGVGVMKRPLLKGRKSSQNRHNGAPKSPYRTLHLRGQSKHRIRKIHTLRRTPSRWKPTKSLDTNGKQVFDKSRRGSTILETPYQQHGEKWGLFWVPVPSQLPWVQSHGQAGTPSVYHKDHLFPMSAQSISGTSWPSQELWPWWMGGNKGALWPHQIISKVILSYTVSNLPARSEYGQRSASRYQKGSSRVNYRLLRLCFCTLNVVPWETRDAGEEKVVMTRDVFSW